LRAIEAGELLLVAKDRIPHGEFLGWLEANCGVSERCAQNYMKCAKGKPAILAEIEKLKSARHADLGTPSVDLTIGRALQVVKGKSNKPKASPKPEAELDGAVDQVISALNSMKKLSEPMAKSRARMTVDGLVERLVNAELLERPALKATG